MEDRGPRDGGGRPGSPNTGELEAESFLGTLLLEGRAGPPEAREAREWLAKAAEKGPAGARKRLAGFSAG